ncbi:MAG: Flp pilus assembly protein CpaB [Chloroflexota bacterium]
MELEFTDRGRRRRLLMIIGVIMALLAFSTAFFLSNQKTATADPVAMRSILVAAQEIPARTVIESGMLMNKQVPDDAQSELAVTDPQQVLGLVTAVTIYENQPITTNLIATSTAGQTWSILSPTETISPYSPVWRGVSLMIPKDHAVGGLISPGQHVDVIATVKIGIKTQDQNGNMVEGTTLDGYYSDDSTKVSLTDIQVLNRDPDSDIYVLKLDLHQAEELAALQSASASFALALRPDGDNRVIDSGGYGETINRIVEHYIYPLPQIIQVDRYPKPTPEIVPAQSPTAFWPQVEPGASASPAPDALSPSPAPSPEASPVPSEAPIKPKG